MKKNEVRLVPLTRPRPWLVKKKLS